jgi:2-C-methyl-D-erythritol 4-phosphate cytidylyltransferase
MIWALIPAAGSGRRFGSELPKQYARLGPTTVLQTTLERLANHPQITGLVVVLAAGDPHWPGWTEIAGRPVRTTIGGAERFDSVIAGLRALPESVADQDFVLVHDAARPCVRGDDISRLIEVAGAAEGGLLAAPVRDTLKQARDLATPTAIVDKTIPRAGLWRAFTPQMFRRGPLLAALQAARGRGEQPTDEAAAMEATGVQPILVEGAEDNLKVTTAYDLRIAELLLAATGSAA